MTHKRQIERLDHLTDYRYKVSISGIPVLAFVWLHNNNIPYTETFDLIDGNMQKLVWFRDEHHAVWFQLKWGDR